MRFVILFFIIITYTFQVYAQNFCEAGGAQGSTIGATDCYPFESACSEEYNAELLLILKTDHKAHESSWEVNDLTEDKVIASGNALVPDTIYEEMICAKADHCYRLIIFDSGSDGMETSQDRGYSVFWNGILKNSGGSFGTSDTTKLGACCDDFSAKLSGLLPCSDDAESQASLEIIGGTPPFEYLWSNGATFTETQPITTNDDRLSVSVTDASNCVAEAKLEGIQGTPITISETHNEGGEVRLSVSGGAGQPYFFEWYNTNDKNRIISNFKDVSGFYDGTYEVKVTDMLGCSETNSVVVSSDHIRFDKDLEKRIKLIPNPTTGKVLLTMDLKEYHKVQIGVYDMLGKKILSIPPENIDTHSLDFDFSNYPCGVFLFRILVDEKVITKKLIHTK